jgi:hypothetical protein
VPYDEAERLTGLEYQTLNDYVWVADSVEISRRREILSFSHHKEIAARRSLGGSSETR